jgi:nucleoid DNA-binding protein
MSSASRNEIVHYVQHTLECTREEARDALEAVLGGITAHISHGRKVSFSGFGSFQPYERGPLRRYDMNTKQTRTLPARPRIRFTASPKLLEAVTNGAE